LLMFALGKGTKALDVVWVVPGDVVGFTGVLIQVVKPPRFVGRFHGFPSSISHCLCEDRSVQCTRI
jgi:hypothetical protein